MGNLPNKSIIQINQDLFIIKLTPPIKGFKDFIAAWLYKHSGLNILVDVGPSTTSNQLLSALAYLKIKYLNYIFLTHIHLDHAGAIGEVVNSFKNAVVVCHNAGISHLVSPKILWEGSLKTLGSIAELYGKPKPVNNANLLASVYAEKLLKKKNDNIKVFDTLGHSSHHMSVCINNYIFLGEAAGVLIKLLPDVMYLRPATPPPLFIRTYLHSLHLIEKIVKEKPTSFLCYAHLSVIESSCETLKKHYGQFKMWMSVIQKTIISSKEESKFSLVEKCLEILLREDPFLRPINEMNKQIQEREYFFIKNSIRGFIEDIFRNK